MRRAFAEGGTQASGQAQWRPHFSLRLGTPPEKQRAKLQELHRYWHDDTWIATHLPERFIYDGHDRLVPFSGTHPAVMKERVCQESWHFEYDPARVKRPYHERLLEWIEVHTGWRPGEFRNYRLI